MRTAAGGLRPMLRWADVERQYWSGGTFEESKGLLHATIHFPEDPEALATFLMQVGDERDPHPQETDHRLRQEARKLLARFLEERIKRTEYGSEKLYILLTRFFAECPGHSGLPKQELELVHSFLKSWYELWYAESVTAGGRYHQTLSDHGEVIVHALVNARAYEYLRKRCLTSAIPHLYSQLHRWLRAESEGVILGFQDHPELLTTWEARTFPCRPSLMVDALGKKKDIELERKFFQMLTSVNALCGAVFTHYGSMLHETHRECALTLLALVAMSSMEHGGA